MELRLKIHIIFILLVSLRRSCVHATRIGKFNTEIKLYIFAQSKPEKSLNTHLLADYHYHQGLVRHFKAYLANQTKATQVCLSYALPGPTCFVWQ